MVRIMQGRNYGADTGGGLSIQALILRLLGYE